MPATNPPHPDRFWLLIGGVPAGPFAAPQVRAKLAAGEVTWGTKVCPVGGAEWLPLHRVPGLAAETSPADRPGSTPAPPADRAGPPAEPPTHSTSPARSPSAGPSRRFRYALLATGVVAALALAYAARRHLHPDDAAGYERGYADTVLRYADRSYDRAGWTRLKESAALAELVGVGNHTPAELWRVAGWDSQNLWVADRLGHLYQLRDDHWRYAGRPESAGYPQLRVLDPDTTLVAGCGHTRHLYRVTPGGAADLGDLGWTNDDRHTEVFPADRDLVYCYPDEAPHLNPGAVRFADGGRTVLREDLYKEAFVHAPDGTPLKDHPVRFLRHTRSHAAGAGYAVSPHWIGGIMWGKKKLARFDGAFWHAVADLPDAEPRDLWLTGTGAAPVVVLVGKAGWVHVRTGDGAGVDRTLAVPTEPTPGNLVKVWGVSPEKFWVMDESGTVWEMGRAESRVVVRGLRREDVAFRDAWVSPTGAVLAITDKHLYRLD